jgi:hypothetical protein
MALAVFMYIVVTKLKDVISSDRWFMWFSYFFCYGMSLLVTIWLFCTDRIGFSPYDTEGWCGTIIHAVKRNTSCEHEAAYMCNESHHDFDRDLMSAIFGYDLWIVLTFVFIIVTYLSLHFFMREEVSGVMVGMVSVALVVMWEPS